MKSIYKQLEEKVLPLMTSFQTDLTKHDKASIGEGNIPFIHYAGETGTQILMLHPASSEAYPPKGEEVKYLFGYADRLHILEQKKVMAKYFITNCHYAKKVFYSDTKKIIEIDHQKALGIVEDYFKAVIKEWSK